MDRYTPDSEGKDVSKAKGEAKPKLPKTTAQLVQSALATAAKKRQTNWSAAKSALFNPAEPNTEAAIAECTAGETPLLTKDGELGSLTPAGFCRLIELTPKKVAELVAAHTAILDAAGRRAVYSALKSRTGGGSAELMYEAIRAHDAEDTRRQEERSAEVRLLKLDGYRAAIAANERTERRLTEELAGIRAETKGLRFTLAEMEAARPEPPNEPESGAQLRKSPVAPGALTGEEKDFRRDVANQLAASWRAAWDAQKDESCDYLESAMWNVSGLKLVGEKGGRTTFDGRYHECKSPVSSGQSVRVVRPGWVLEEGESDYVALKAVVDPT